jgi:hypothetical protein
MYRGVSHVAPTVARLALLAPEGPLFLGTYDGALSTEATMS